LKVESSTFNVQLSTFNQQPQPVAMTSLIFGINGQDGSYLSELLKAENISVIGVSRSAGAWQRGSVADHDFVEQLIKREKPDYIFHLAANSAVHHELLFEHQQTIVQGSLNILESAYRHSPKSKIFIAGSGLQFLNKEKPVSEKTKFHAGNSYTLARIQAVYAARYFRTLGLRTYIGYLFHHDSPLRTAQHLNRRIVDAAKQAAAGSASKISIGDITVEKEFGFAGDIAGGILKLVQQDELFEACIGTGKAHSIKEWLKVCFNLVGKKWKDYVETDNTYKADFKRLVSDPSSMKKIGWEAKTGMKELAEMMMR
jgi:GDPmannose 4,6-dehydratase